MSQDLIQDGSQDNATLDGAKTGGNTSSGGSTGATCMETSLYKASDGKIQFIEYISAGSAYPPFPGGKGTRSCTWTRLSVASDGNKASFESVLVEAGTL